MLKERIYINILANHKIPQMMLLSFFKGCNICIDKIIIAVNNINLKGIVI